MKKFLIYVAGAAFAFAAASCSEEQLGDGQGNVTLRASINSDVEVVSRASDAELAENCVIWISSDKGLVRQYNGIGEVPASIDLVSGRYVAEAWAGDSVSASFSDRCFKGYEVFNVEAGKTTQVDLVCKIANVVASVNYQENLEDFLSDIKMTVGHNRGSLIFEGRDDRKGYFMMPSTSTGLSYELEGTQVDGSPFYFAGTIDNVKPATEYVLNVSYSVDESNIGGAVFTIKIVENEITVNTEIELIAAPRITGYDFDINKPLVSELGAMGRRCVYITSATGITDIELRSELFTSMSTFLGEDVNILKMNEDGEAALNALGINHSVTQGEQEGSTIVQINFEEEFTNALANGDYTIAISATDDKGKTSNATMQLSISDAPVLTTAASDVEMYAATLTGVVNKDEVESIGFNYRAAGTSEWTYVEASSAQNLVKGSTFTARLENLNAFTEYEFAAVSGDYVSAVVEKFTTLDGAQLPNCSFEDWCNTSDGVLIPGTDTSNNNNFWDTGNHGSNTMSVQVTQQNTNSLYVADGKSSAKLRSQFVGVDLGFMKAGKFAAGNIFVGKYLDTEGTDGILGWGKPFDGAPKSVTFYVRYEPGTVVSGNNMGSGEYMPVGATDQGMVYVALMDDSSDEREKTYKEWPIVIRTKTSQLFEKENPHIIAYGEMVFDKATDGSGLVKVTMPLEYRSDATPSRIVFVASASRYGDYFQGGEGSTLYLDNIHMDY
ncbi:MAG: DUF4493 domain-containing protein [Muribaculaceae bacterium]|nr:DUF4493 domain-containing protein [Muribaculaceae bacterium]